MMIGATLKNGVTSLASLAALVASKNWEARAQVSRNRIQYWSHWAGLEQQNRVLLAAAKGLVCTMQEAEQSTHVQTFAPATQQPETSHFGLIGSRETLSSKVEADLLARTARYGNFPPRLAARRRVTSPRRLAVIFTTRKWLTAAAASLTSTQVSLSTDHCVEAASCCKSLALTLRGGGARTALSWWTELGPWIQQSTARCWLLLFMSTMAECCATALNKHAHETESKVMLLVACCVYTLTLVGFNICLARIEVGIAYAVWAALGTFVVAAAGIVIWGESRDPIKIGCLALILMGVVGLNLREMYLPKTV